MKHTEIDETIPYVDKYGRVVHILDPELHYDRWRVGGLYRKTPDIDGRKAGMLCIVTSKPHREFRTENLLRRPAFTLEDYVKDQPDQIPESFLVTVLKPRALEHEFWVVKDEALAAIKKKQDEQAALEARMAERKNANAYFTRNGFKASTVFNAPLKFNHPEMVALHKEFQRLRDLEQSMIDAGHVAPRSVAF